MIGLWGAWKMSEEKEPDSDEIELENFPDWMGFESGAKRDG